MKQEIVRTIEIKGSVVKVSNLEKPVEPDIKAHQWTYERCTYVYHVALEMYNQALEAFNASLVEVKNVPWLFEFIKPYDPEEILLKAIHNEIEGTYPAPEGLLMEVREVEITKVDANSDQETEFLFNRAFLSFASPKQSPTSHPQTAEEVLHKTMAERYVLCPISDEHLPYIFEAMQEYASIQFQEGRRQGVKECSQLLRFEGYSIGIYEKFEKLLK